VLRALDAFVSSRTIILAGSGRDEAGALREVCALATRLAGDRPVFYRANGGWRMARAGGGGAVAVASTEVAGAGAAAAVAGAGERSPLTDAPVGRFAAPPAQIMLGEAPSLGFEVLPAAPDGAEVLFQTWSDASGSIEAAVVDDQAPFAYSGDALNQVTPGPGAVQAIVRDAAHRPIGLVSLPVEFVAGGIAGSSGGGQGGGLPPGQLVWYEDFESGDYARWSSVDYDSGWSSCTNNRFADNRFVSVGHSHKSRIKCASETGLHRGYGLLRFDGDALVPSISIASPGGIESEHGVVVTFWTWLKAPAGFGDGRWVSLFTVTDDCSNAWEGVVTLGLQDETGRLAPAHVDSWDWVPGAPAFPLRQWVRTTIYLNYHDGAMHVWQDGEKVCHASFQRPGTSLCQWHFGLYGSGDNEDVVLYEDDLRITRLAAPLPDFQTEPLYGPGPLAPEDGSGAGSGGGAGGGGSDDGDGGSGDGPPAVARFDDPDDPYVLGSGRSIGLELMEEAPEHPSVVFQVWSDGTSAVEAAYPDYQAPFVYPSAVLEQVPPGTGELQAIVRDAEQEVVATITRPMSFVPRPVPDTWAGERLEATAARADAPPESGSGGGDSNGNGGNGSGSSTGGAGGSGDTDVPPGGPPPVGPGGSAGELARMATGATSGAAPFAVHVHALQSTLPAGDVLSARFQWDFGDPDGAFDRLEGFNAAHVYDQPGTYELTLTVTEPSSAVRTVARAVELLGDGTAVLLRRGATYPLSASLRVEGRDVLVGAYGTGDPPVLQWTGPAQTVAAIIELAPSARDVTVEDLALAGIPSPTTDTVRGVAVKGRTATVRRCAFAGVGTAIMAEAGGVDGLLTLGNEAGVLGAYFVWGEGRDHVHLGNSVAGSVDQHNMRFVADRVLVAHNTLTNTVKSCVWLQAGKFGYVRGNTVHEGPVQVGPIPQVGPAAARWRWAVLDGNRLDGDAYKVFHGAKHVILRNNVCRRDDGTAFDVLGFSDEMQRSAVDVRILHNTVINQSPAGRFLSVKGRVVDMILANNMYVAPALATGDYGTANVYVEDDDLGGFALIRGNLWTEPATAGWGDGWHYCWPSWAHPDGYLDAQEWAATGKPQDEAYRRFAAEDLDEDLRPQFDAGGAPAVPGVHADLHGTSRPLTGTVTAGAVQ
jgi:hypothetical protein